MSDILLSPQVGINIFVESILFMLLFVTFFHAIVILKNYRHGVTTEYQYQLQNRSYLLITVISFALVVKILLLIFFTYTLDELSNIVPGAMCAAGVIKTNIYGNFVLILKLIIIMLIFLWLNLNKEDQLSKNHLFFKQKFYFFILIFVFIAIEFVLEILFFTNISTQSPVLCCSSIYKAAQNTTPMILHLSATQLITLFYLVYLMILTFCYLKKRVLLFISSLVYLYISYYAIVYFFGTYIYELPTHKCPFCMLQSDYHYIGYLIFGSLFIATYYALCSAVYNFSAKFDKTVFYYTVFVIVTSFHFISYILKNGVLL